LRNNLRHYIRSLLIMTKPFEFSSASGLRMSLLKAALLILLMVMGVTPALTASPTAYVLTGEERGADIWQHMQLLTDPQNMVNTAAITANPQAFAFEPLQNTSVNQGITDQVFWLTMRLHNPQQKAINWVMAHETPYIDVIEVFVRDTSSDWQHQILSDREPFHARPIDYRNLAFSHQTEAGEITEVLLRVQMEKADSVTLRFLLSEQQQFEQLKADEHLLFGLYFGASLALAVISLLMWLALRSRVFFEYWLYLISNLLIWGSLTGYSYQFLWPNSPWLHNEGFHLIYLFFVLMALQFSKTFLDLKQYLPKIHFGISVFQGLLLFTMLLRFAGLYETVLVISYAAIVSMLALPVLGWYCYRRGLLFARWYAIAWSVYAVGLLLSVLSASSSLFDWGMQPLLFTMVASLMESFLLILALADKVRQIRLQYEKARNESHHDALTGVGNRRLLTRWFYRWCQDITEKRLWVLLIDIDEFKKINDSFGHSAGDVILKNLAAQLQQQCRPQDLVVRLGGEEFLLLIEAETADDALQIAERIRHTFYLNPSLWQSHTITHSLSVGVSEVLEHKPEGLQLAIDRADQAMYQAKQSGRNTVRLFEASHHASVSLATPFSND